MPNPGFFNGDVDSKAVVQNSTSTNMDSVFGLRLIQKIMRLLNMDRENWACHSYRESNSCVNVLINISCEHSKNKNIKL